MTSADRSAVDPRRWPVRLLPGPAAMELRFDIGGLRDVRAAIAAHASRIGAPCEQVERLIIVASELATNAVRHGGGSGRLRMWHQNGAISCQVIDAGPGIADPTIGTSRPDPADTEGHRGLWICRNLAEEVEIRANPDGPGITVTAVIAS